MSTALKNSANSTSTTLAPTENYTLTIADDAVIPFRIEDQGKLAGSSNAGIYSIFARFILPAYTPGTEITNADFILHAVEPADGDYPLSLYVIDNAWQINAMDKDHRPMPTATPVTSFRVASGDDAVLSLTSAANAAYHQDGILTLLVTNAEYHYNLQFFAPEKSLRISISAP